jgi:hypothetical protein
VDASGAFVTYEAAKVLDRDLTTAWRTPGDGTGQVLTLEFERRMNIARIGLLPGYAKVDSFDDTNRFTQNRRVLRVRYVFDDGTTLEQGFAERAEVQFVDHFVASSGLKIEILATSDRPEKDFTALSEVVIYAADR